MGKREIQSKSRYLWAFIIGTGIFLLGFYLTFLVSQTELREIGKIQTDISYGLFEQKIIDSFFYQDVCSEYVHDKINEYRDIQIGSIDSLERKYGLEDKRVLEKKKFYTLIQIAHLEFLEERQIKCNESKIVLLFFYSNLEKDVDESIIVGRLLDNFLYDQEGIQLYSFDFNLDSELVRLIKEKYGVSQYPVVIRLGGGSVVSPKNIAEIREIVFENE